VDLGTHKLLFKIAKAYYEDGLTQEEIGRRLGLSRIKISRLLRRAREQSVVRITVVPPQDPNAEMERTLEACYGLDEAIVVSSSSYDRAAIARGLGPAAASCLVRSLQGHEVLALTWGTTLLSVVDALPARNWPQVKVVQMLGGLGRPEADIYGADLVHRVAQAFGARPRIVPAPGIVSSKMVRDALLADPQISSTLGLAAQAEVALVGIGRPTPDSVVMQAGILGEQEFEQLLAQGVVGDIALRFFDLDGRQVEHEINDRIIGLELEEIRRIPRVIGVAGGPEKHEVIRAALRGHIVDVLVTDDGTAARLIEEVEAAPVRERGT
jgi:DNA-binding transcriptional regulator LsrR (DeoR family)